MRTNVLDLLIPLLLVLVFVALGYSLLGWLPAIVFTVAFGGGFVLYVFTSWRTQFDTMKVIVPYLLTIIFFVIHVYEEYITGFENLVSDISGIHVLQSRFLLVAAFIAPIVWITGAILIIKKTALGYYFLCAFFFAMMVAELSHFVFPFLEDGTFHYSSGMYTAALPLLPAFYGFSIMMREIRNLRQNSGDRSEHNIEASSMSYVTSAPR